MSQSITSAVAVPPMLWIPHQLVGAPLGYSVVLECYTEAHPTSLNYWAREDGLMIHESSKYKTISQPDKPSYKTHMTLTINDIQVSEGMHLVDYQQLRSRIYKFKNNFPNNSSYICNCVETIHEKRKK